MKYDGSLGLSIQSLKMALLCLLIIGSIKCSSPNHKLNRIEHEKLLERINNLEIDYIHASYRDSIGAELCVELRRELNQGKLRREFFTDQSGIVKEIRVLKMRHYEDIFNEIRLVAAIQNPFLTVHLPEVDCRSINKELTDAYFTDQEVRTGQIPSNLNQVDEENRLKVIALIEKCGWEQVDTNMINNYYYVFQHMPPGLMARYYPDIVKFNQLGYIDNFNLARMQDRLLMNNNYPQIYGTQINNNTSFYRMIDPYNVNKRRAAMGIDSIESWAKKYDFTFNPEDYLGEEIF